MSLSWRTAPRSIIKTLYWFKSVESIKNLNWNETLGVKSKFNKSIHPTRRKFLYDIASKEDIDDDSSSTKNIRKLNLSDFISGSYDWTKEPESNARQRWTTFEQFGFSYLDNGIVTITPVGLTVIDDTFDSDQLIAQLLKMYTPFSSGGGIYIFREFIKMIRKFNYLNRWEMSFLFAPNNIKDLGNISNAISDFRKLYLSQKNKREKNVTKKHWVNVWEKYFGMNWTETQKKDEGKSYWNDYSDAFSRSLIYTFIFEDSGVGEATKLRVKDLEKDKFRMLFDVDCKVPDDRKSSEKQVEWFGDADNVKLPWDKPRVINEIVFSKLKVLRSKMIDKYDDLVESFSVKDLKENKISLSRVKLIEKQIDDLLSDYSIKIFVKTTSNSKAVHDDIIERYSKISNGDSDMAALWLEANTWKFFASLTDNPEKAVYNGKLNPDLSPRNYAKGVGNTPDMEVYDNNNILLPEVSLMSGVQQWEHEGSSVAEHVLYKKKMNPDKNVTALFLSKKTNFRSQWLFFMLNKDSWAGYPVPVIPIEIERFIRIVKFSYENSLKINDILKLINNMHNIVFNINDFQDWQKSMENEENKWMSSFS